MVRPPYDVMYIVPTQSTATYMTVEEREGWKFYKPGGGRQKSDKNVCVIKQKNTRTGTKIRKASSQSVLIPAA